MSTNDLRFRWRESIENEIEASYGGFDFKIHAGYNPVQWAAYKSGRLVQVGQASSAFAAMRAIEASIPQSMTRAAA